MSDKQKTSDIAITGMAASFAGAENLLDYWHRIIGRKRFDGGAENSPENLYVEPHSEINGDNHHAALSLRIIRAAFDDAGYPERPIDEKTSVLVSLSCSSSTGTVDRHEAEINLQPTPAHIVDQLRLTSRNEVACKVFPSSLAAIEAAMRELLARNCDVALAGGVYSVAPHSFPNHQGSTAQPGALPNASQIGETPASEGGAIVVLKRLADALQDNDRIYAVLKNVSVFQHDSTGPPADADLEDTINALRRAYRTSGVEPDSLALIEASAAGVPLVSRHEMQLLSSLFGTRRSQLPRCALGSVNDIVGEHGRETVGVAGVIKAALALYYKILPPAIRAELEPPAQIEKTPFYLNAEPRAWIHGSRENPRRAGVYDFAPQAMSTHAILEEYKGHATLDMKLPNSGWPVELLCFSGESRAELLSQIASVQKYIDKHPREPLAHLAFTLAERKASRKHRLAVLASDLDDLRVKLNLACEKLNEKKQARWQFKNSLYYAESAAASKGKVAFMFPGYGSYYTGMLSDLCLHFPPIRDWFDTLDEFFDEADGPLPSQLLFPTQASLSDESQTATTPLHVRRGGGQGGFTATLALHELLQNLGIRCDVMVGHSNGENAALIASGTIRFKERREMFELTRRYTEHDDRKLSTAHIPTGVFLSVSMLGGEFLEQLIAASDNHLYLAMDNCRHQVVLFGPENGIEEIQEQIRRSGGIALRLPFDRAYHTPLYEVQAEDMRDVYAPLDFGPGHTRIYSCVTAQPFPAQPDAIRALAIKQWSSPVRFRETIENLYREGVRIFIEVGPNTTLAGFVDDTLRGREHVTIASNTQRRPGLEQIQRLLGQLFVEGMDLNPGYLFKFRNVRRVELVPSLTESQVAEQSLALPASPATAAVRTPTENIKAQPVNNLHHNPPHTYASAAAAQSAVHIENEHDSTASSLRVFEASTHTPDVRLAILRQHFSLMQQFLASQSRVMSTLFGETVAVAAANVGEEIYSRAETSGSPVQNHVDGEAWPLLGHVVEMDARRLYCERRFDLASDTFLLDHALGRKPPGGDARLSPLTLMPFTMSMEILAEAACYLLGGKKKVVGIHNVRGHRWLMLERGSFTLGVLAEVRPSQVDGAEDVHVRLFDLGTTPDGQRQLSFEGTVRLASDYPAAPPPLPLQIEEGGRVAVSASEFYEQFAFHGPCFQGIKHVRAWDAQGIEVELEATEASRFFRQAQSPSFQIPSALLDVTGQLVGLWHIEQGVRDFAVFPFHVARFQQYEQPPSPGSRIICRGAIQLKDTATREASFDVLDETGRVLARLEGLQLRMYRQRYISRFFQPQTSDTYFSEPWMQEETGLACRIIDSQIANFLEESGGLWKRVLAHLVLNAEEREEWYGLPEKGGRQTEWLMGRAAAKDAVRQWARQTLQLKLRQIEIAITTNALGQPLVRCRALEERQQLPHVSISHKRGLAVSVAASSGIGIDVEQLDAHQDTAWLQNSFSAEELSLTGRLDATTLLSLWCAREAASKAAGTGLQGDPRLWRIVHFSPHTGLVRVASDGNVWDVALWYREKIVMAVCQAAAPANRREGSLAAATVPPPLAMKE
jgi:acyl transferase domain-containing protein/phosphopantetheinyl transferase